MDHFRWSYCTWTSSSSASACPSLTSSDVSVRSAPAFFSFL